MVGLRAVAEFDTFHPEGDALQAVGISSAAPLPRRRPAGKRASRQ